MRWQKGADGRTWVAYSGAQEIGFAGEIPLSEKPRFFWRITAVQGSKYLPATGGERSTEAAAKAAFRRAWQGWLAARGLVEAA